MYTSRIFSTKPQICNIFDSLKILYKLDFKQRGNNDFQQAKLSKIVLLIKDEIML